MMKSFAFYGGIDLEVIKIFSTTGLIALFYATYYQMKNYFINTM